MIERYPARPQELSVVCLAEFASWYTLKTKQQENTDSDA